MFQKTHNFLDDRFGRKYVFWLFLYFYLHKQLIFHYNKNVGYLTVFKSAASSLLGTITNKKQTLKYKKVKNLYIFTFIRNLFSRIYSCYNDKFKKTIKLKENFYYAGYNYLTKKFKFIQFYPEDSFATFVKKVAEINDRSSDTHFRAQHYYLYRKSKCLVNYIGRFENLKKDFEPIKKQYQLQEILHRNKSQKNKDEWKKHYTQELADLVYERYKKDFDLWYPNAYKELISYLNKKKKNK